MSQIAKARLVCTLTLSGLLGICAAFAEADGPDFWAVKGIAKGHTLILRATPSIGARRIASIPHDARRLKNLGCRGGPTFAQWSKMTPSARKEAALKRWCQVEFRGKRGWVAGRFLAE